MKIKDFIQKNKIILLILVLAGILRFWNLGNVPPSLTPDEASLGYNAYSILKTGHDEYGKYFPIIFKSFGDYKPGLYVYLTIPFVAIFGLNEWTVRLPSAIAGVLIVYLLYLITGKMSDSLKNDKWRMKNIVALVATITPWLIYFSRGAWEANLSLAFTLCGIYFFLKALKSEWWMVGSGLFFALTLLTYQGAKLSTLIVMVLLGIIYWKEILNINKKYLIYGFITGLLISLPIIISLFNGQSQRLEVFSIFSYHRPVEETQKFAGNFYQVFNSEPLNYTRAIIGRWFNVFSGKFLFFEGDQENPIHTAPYQGVLLLSDILLLPLGLFYLFRNYSQSTKHHTLFVLLWLILAPLSAAISRDTTNAVRSLNTAIPLIFISSFGLYYLINRLKFGIVLTAFCILASAFYFGDAYFIHVPKHNSQFWRYGYKEAMEYVQKNKDNYKSVVFEQSYNQPYIYYLFYSKKILTTDLQTGENIKDVGLVRTIDGIEFGKVDWQVLRNQKSVLVVATSNQLNLPVKKEIKYLNNYETAFNIIEL